MTAKPRKISSFTMSLFHLLVRNTLIGGLLAPEVGIEDYVTCDVAIRLNEPELFPNSLRLMMRLNGDRLFKHVLNDWITNGSSKDDKSLTVMENRLNQIVEALNFSPDKTYPDVYSVIQDAVRHTATLIARGLLKRPLTDKIFTLSCLMLVRYKCYCILDLIVKFVPVRFGSQIEELFDGRFEDHLARAISTLSGFELIALDSVLCHHVSLEKLGLALNLTEAQASRIARRAASRLLRSFRLNVEPVTNTQYSFDNEVTRDDNQLGNIIFTYYIKLRQGRLADSTTPPQPIDRVPQSRAEVDATYAVLVEKLRHQTHVLREQVAAELASALNDKVQRMEHETLDQKKELGRWVNAQLEPLGLAVREPKTGRPGKLRGARGNWPGKGCFQIEVKIDGEQEYPTVTDSVPKLTLMDADPPQEVVSHFQKLVKKKNKRDEPGRA